MIVEIAGATEEEMFNCLGLSYIPSELRENIEEIDLAIKNKLPELITQKDIKGDLHIHSNWSDGTSTIEEIVFIAKTMGYEYIAICDHSASHLVFEASGRNSAYEVRLRYPLRAYILAMGSGANAIAPAGCGARGPTRETTGYFLAA